MVLEKDCGEERATPRGGVKAVNEERQKGNFSRLSLSLLLFSFSILETFFDSPSGDLSSEAAAAAAEEAFFPPSPPSVPRSFHICASVSIIRVWLNFSILWCISCFGFALL